MVPADPDFNLQDIQEEDARRFSSVALTPTGSSSIDDFSGDFSY